MRHAELVERAEKWLKKRYGVVCSEVACYSIERPDAIGFSHMGGAVIECKASHADFLKDLKKPHRQEGYCAFGNRRYFMCVPGLIKASELPNRWGLLYCHPAKIEVVRESDAFEANHYSLMYSLLRRAVLRGFNPNERLKSEKPKEAVPHV